MSAAVRSGLLLVGHGTRQPAGNSRFLALAAALVARLDPAIPVEPCFLEHAEPTIAAGIDRLVERGAVRVAVVPLFLFAAGHLLRDLPRLLSESRAGHPGIAIDAGGPLWPDPLLAELCAELLRRGDRSGGDGSGSNAGVTAVLVARGSSDAAAAAGADLAGLAAEAAARLGTGARVLHAFADLATPQMAEALEAAPTGSGQILVLPLLLFPGVLLDRIAALAGQRRESLLVAPEGLAAHPAFLDLLAARCDEALATGIRF